MFVFYNGGVKKASTGSKAQIKQLNAQLAQAQAELVLVNKAAGIDDYITVKLHKNQARFERIKKSGEPDRSLGHYFMQLDITAKTETVYIPLSIATGKKPAGFMYQVEGTAESSVVSTDITCRGEGVNQVTLGTIVYVKIPALKTASFRILMDIRGSQSKVYEFFIYRINYKRNVTDARYGQYLKVIHSDRLKFS